jgi:SnoaL-like polyketide cyclase
MPPGCRPGADAMKKSAALFHAGVEECTNKIEDVIAAGDKVTVRYTTVTHTGELFGVPHRSQVGAVVRA